MLLAVDNPYIPGKQPTEKCRAPVQLPDRMPDQPNPFITEALLCLISRTRTGKRKLQFMKKRVFIAGATGLLGQAICKALIGNYSVFAAHAPNSPKIKKLPQDVIPVALDLSQPNLNVLPEEIETVIYLAQSPRFREFPEGSSDMIGVNILSPVLLADWAAKSGVSSFIYASSGGIYGNKNEFAPESQPIDNFSPLNFYFDTKRSAELLLRNFSPLFSSLLILRPFFIFGPGQNPSMLIPRIIQNVAKGNPITLNGEEGIQINPIFVEDAARAVVQLMKIPGFQIFNLAGKETLSIRQIATLAGQVIGVKPIFEYTTPTESLLGDIKKLQGTGFDFQTDFLSGLKKTAADLTENGIL